MKSFKLKIALLFLTFSLFSVNSYSQTKDETVKYFHNLVKDSWGIGYYSPFTIKKVVSVGTEKIEIDAEEYVSLDLSIFHKYSFNVSQVTGLNLDGKSVIIVVSAQCVSVEKDKKSLENKARLPLYFENADIAKEKYSRMVKALTHLAKEYNGEYNYDIFAN